MKKTLFPLMLAALMASCANDDLGNTALETGQMSSEATNGYISVKLVAPGDLYGRADGQYQYGTPEENYVNSVRFFFFTSSGAPSMIRKNPLYDSTVEQSTELQYFSYYDWYPTSSENSDGQQGSAGGTQTDPDNSGELQGNTVEKILSSMLVLNIMEDETKANTPAYIVAVVNPTTNVSALVNPSLATLQSSIKGSTMVADYLTGLTDKNFVMSSTVYVDDKGNEIVAQPILSDNLCTTQVEAQKNQLVVYVERVVARMNVTIDDTKLKPITVNGEKLYPTGFNFESSDRDFTQTPAAPSVPEAQADDPDTPADPSVPSDPTETQPIPIYVKFLGWAVTGTPVKSNLIKDIDTEWGGDEELFDVINQPWFVPTYHRSFWAMNPQELTVGTPEDEKNYVWFTYDQLAGTNDTKQIGLPMSTTQTYMQENANPYNTAGTAANPLEPTKVIYAAQLVDNTGKEMTITEWNGLYFTEDGLKNLAVSMLDMWYDKNNGQGEPDYKKITANELTFMTRTEFMKNGPIFFNKNYNCYLTLTTAAMGKTWYHKSDTPASNGAYTYTQIKDTQLKEYMESAFGVAKIWKNGYTYYYYEVKHLGNQEKPGTPGQMGVVRNHIYSANVNKLSGLGTPVWKSSEEIYPEHPANEGNNISAQVQVLMWRLVSDDYSFNW